MHSEHVDRNIRLLYAFWFLRDFQLWIPVWIVFLIIERGFSLTEVTTAEGLYLVGVVVLEVPTGAVADRWGRSRSLALGALCLGGAVLIFAFTTSFGILLASFLLWSVAHTLMSGADSALLFDTLRAGGREEEFEHVAGRGVACSWAGAGIATLAGGPVAALFDIRATIIFGAATCLVTAVMGLMLWEAPRRHSASPEPYLAGIRGAFREVWRASEVRAVVLLAGTTFAAIESVHYLVQPYLLNRGVEVGVFFSLLQAPMLLAGIGGAWFSSRLQGRIGPIRLLLGLPMVAVVGYAALAASPGLAAYAAFPVMFALGSCIRPVAGGYVNRRVGSERRATILSMQGMVSSLVLAALAPAAGSATDQWGLSPAFALVGAFTVVALVLFGGPLLGRRSEGGPPAAAPLDA